MPRQAIFSRIRNLIHVVRRAFDPPKHPVLSLGVQAGLYADAQPERTQFQTLVRHFLDRFFAGPSANPEGQAKSRLLQIAYALALPGVCVAIYLFPPYHFPGGRPFWAQVGDHYFYVLYSFVAMGAVTIFAWDLFFPDLLDVFALSTLSIERRTLFLARTAAIALFLGGFLLGANALGGIFFPAATDLPSLARHLFAHFAAVTLAGLCVSSFFLAAQSSLLALLGERFFRKLSPFLQGLSIAALLTLLLLFPLLSRFLEALLDTGRQAAFRFSPLWFPPFWFLGVYERLLHGSSALPVFASLARAGCGATAVAVVGAAFWYPLAYRSRMRHVVEGSGAATANQGSVAWLTAPLLWLLHGTLLRTPQRRGVFHFVGQTLFRTPRHRVALAMYGGLGLALALASAVMLKLGDGRVRLAVSPDGLRAVVPIAAFWTVAGLRAAFLGPADRRVNWVFKAIHGKPGPEESAATRTWVLLGALAITLAALAVVHAVAPTELGGARGLALQGFVAASLCLLLTDAFFLNGKTIPFTGIRSPSSMNLAYVLIQYFGIFPPFVLLAVGAEEWLGAGAAHWLFGIAVVVAAHLELLRRHAQILRDSAHLPDAEDDEDEFPQRLGLRY